LKGSAKRITFANGGEIIDISVQPSVLMKALEWMNKKRAEGGIEESEWVRLRIKEKRQEDEYGNTHYVELNTWLPSGSAGSAEPKAAAKSATPVAKKSSESSGPDLPF
jgi:hypothetical protein